MTTTEAARTVRIILDPDQAAQYISDMTETWGSDWAEEVAFEDSSDVVYDVLKWLNEIASTCA